MQYAWESSKASTQWSAPPQNIAAASQTSAKHDEQLFHVSSVIFI